MTYNISTFTTLAAAQAEADDHLRCVLAAREEAIGDAVQAGVTLAAIAEVLGIAVLTVAASRDRALAASPPPAGVEPRLTPDWGEVYATSPGGDVAPHWYNADELALDLAEEWGISEGKAQEAIEARYDPRGGGELDADVVLAIHHNLWEAHRDPAAGTAELRGLRAWRYRQGFTLTPPEDMILAAACTGAYRAAVAQAAAVPRREVEEMMTERGVPVDHTTIYRWVQKYAPELDKHTRWYRQVPDW